MESRENHQLLIYHTDAKLYEAILLKRLPHLEIHSAERPEEASGFIEEAEIILSWKIPDELLKRARHLQWFSSTAAGNEHLVKNPHLPESVVFTRATVYGEMMAEYVFAYLLYFARDLSKYFLDQRQKIWEQRRPERLRGKVLGILGLGSVGKEIARRGKQFGMDVLGLKRTPEAVEDVDQVFGHEDIRRMIPQVDYLINTLPLTEETYHLLREEELSRLKEEAIFFNIGRGKTVDEKALVQVLKGKNIRAVLDVFEEEPLSPESELWNLENVIITPHVSGINIPEEICEEFVRNYERWVKGQPLTGLVDRSKGY
ncbi:MAG: D-2-hydroxyacid dehydrogenase [Thermodesulfobacteriota bacterium]|nr:D-2-hydroxyacid dehydrogenase [Thermodesulfobacteriota bacterium]